jgi:hypothetical protein
MFQKSIKTTGAKTALQALISGKLVACSAAQSMLSFFNR